MRVDILSVQPNLLKSFFSYSIIKRAIYKKILSIYIHDLKNYGLGKHNKVDDYPYGGGSGMVMRIEPIYNCLNFLFSFRKYDEVIYMSPDGEILSQDKAKNFSFKKNLIILCGHYKGVDQRVRDKLITCEISIGNYILSGGELPSAVLVDCIVRLIPGVLGNVNSVLEDSFQRKNFISSPIYTRPSKYKNLKVPEILLSGDFKKIEKWKIEKSKFLTFERKKNKKKN